MIRRCASYLMTVLVLAATPVMAGTLKQAPTALDPAKAYVVAEIGKLDDGLLYGSLVLARYDPARQDIAEPTVAPDGKVRKPDNRIYLLKSAIKSGDQSFYIVELDPGLWVVEGANDTAFSLGSSTLQLAPGSVTDLGVVSVYSDFPQGEKRDVVTSARLLKGALLGGMFGRVKPAPMPKAVDFRARTTADMVVPPLLAGVAHPVEWAGEVRFGNHLGGLVNRMGGRKARFRALAADNGAVQPEATGPQATGSPAEVAH